MALLALAGCAGSGSDPLARDISRLEAEVQRLRSQRENDRARLDSLEAEVRRVSQARATKSSLVPHGLAVVRVEPGSAADEEEGSAFIVDVSDRDGARPARRNPPRPPPMGGATGGVDAAPPLPTDVELREPGEPSPSPVAYETAEEAFRSGDFARASGLFAAFVDAAPRDPLADNALLAQGEALLELGESARALAAFERVATGYPAGDAVPEALLRYGETCLSLGRNEAARAAFTRVVEDHPGSAPAEAATGRLAGL